MLIGGILIILFGLLNLSASAFRIFSPLSFLHGAVHAIAEIVIGVVCILGSKYVSNLAWAIILLILGLVAGEIGGTLVILGAVIGLVSQLVKLS